MYLFNEKFVRVDILSLGLIDSLKWFCKSKNEGLKFDLVSFELTNKLLSLYLNPSIFEIFLSYEIFSEVKLPPKKLVLILY